MSGCVAVINAGSSSVKFALCEASNETNIIFSGQIERIGVAPRLRVMTATGEVLEERTWSADGFNHDAATREILTTGARLISGTPVIGIGHRVVHGGMMYDAPIRLDQAVLTTLEQFIPLAPLHQPHNLAPIRTILDAAPQISQVACFDTAFHRTQPPVAQSFALPRRFNEGGCADDMASPALSYEYLVSQLYQLCPEVWPRRRVIMAHLGNGASLCAVHEGRKRNQTRWASRLLMGS